MHLEREIVYNEPVRRASGRLRVSISRKELKNKKQ